MQSSDAFYGDHPSMNSNISTGDAASMEMAFADSPPQYYDLAMDQSQQIANHNNNIYYGVFVVLTGAFCFGTMVGSFWVSILWVSSG